MSRIISYPYDDSIKAKDAWVGTDEASRQTKQYTAEALAEYLNISGSISIIGQMTYKYGTTPLNGIGTLAVFGGGPDIVAFSAVVKLTLSNQDISNQRVVEFLDLLVGSDILIAEQGAISTFGYYSIDSYAINATDSNYYDLGVTFKSGNGSMRSDRIYEAQNFVLANDATQSPWNTVPDGISYTAANVGIGTVAPSEKLEVSGGIIGDTLFVRNTDGYNAELLSNNLTTNKTFNFPDVGGTLALTTDITSSPWDTVTGGINYANGNVGIGTTSPSEKLEVSGGNIKGDGLIQVENASDNNIIGKLVINYGSSNNPRLSSVGGTEIDFQTDLVIRSNKGLYSDTSSSTGLIIGSQRANTPIKFLTSPTTHLTYSEAMRIAGDGNVGIGTTSPSEKLEVAGQYGNTTLSGHAIGFTRAGGNYLWAKTSGGDLRFTVNGNPIGSASMIISSSGNVGIGATSPSEKLEVDGNIQINRTDSAAARLTIGTNRTFGRSFYLENNGTNQYIVAENTLAIKTLNNDTQIVLEGGGSTDNVQFITNESERMRITNTGVGIGTTSPLYKLDIDEPTTNNLIVSRFKHNQGGVASAVQLENRAGAVNSAFDINWGLNSSGNQGTIGVVRTNLPAAGGSEMYFKTSYGEAMRIDGSGNVGIGATSPSEKLDVEGNIRVGVNNGFYITNQNVGIKRVANDLVVGGFGGIRFTSSSTTVPNQAERMRITSAGNVGIGTTSPQGKLDISTATSGDIFNLRIHNLSSESAQSTGILFNAGYTDVSRGKGGLVYEYDTSAGWNRGDFHFLQRQDAGTGIARLSDSVVTIKNSGNVGIGTTSPSEKLEVDGNIKFSNGALFDSKTVIGANANDLTISTPDFLKLDPGYGDLQVTSGIAMDGGISTGGRGKRIVFGGGEDYLMSSNTDNDVLLSSWKHIRFGAGSGSGESNFSEKMRITSAGNVGIGTTSPISKLHVNGDARIGDLRLVSAGGADYIQSDANIRFSPVGTSSGTRMTILSTGNVGIGTTSPSEKLEVTGPIGSTKLTGYKLIFTRNANNEIFTEGASSTLTLGTNSVERMRINSAGNVGIGTTSPLSKFQVNGQASVLGNGFYGLAYLGGANALSSYDTANKIVMSSNGSTDGLYTGGLHLTRRALTQQGHYGSGIRGISVGTVLQDNALELYTSTNTQQNATRLKITSTGNVGIGTTTPSYPFVVKRTGSNVVASFEGDQNTYLRIARTGTQSGEAQLRVTNNGNLSITSDSNISLKTGGVSGTTRLYVRNNDGNVGIGTTSPSQKLEVDGQVLSDGYRLAAMQTAPATRNSTGTLGEIVIDGNHIYVCYATDSWSRVALETSW